MFLKLINHSFFIFYNVCIHLNHHYYEEIENDILCL